MVRLLFSRLAIVALIQLILGIALTPPSLAQEWERRVKPRGTIRVVDLWLPSTVVQHNVGEGLVTLDKDSNVVPCLAEDWRWIDDRTIEFQLREGVRFHNGERFNAEAVRVLSMENLSLRVAREVVSDPKGAGNEMPNP